MFITEEEEQRILRGMEDSLRHCGKLMLEADRSGAFVDTKEGHGNFVTFYDKQNQEYLKSAFSILLPEAVFVGEEEDVHARIEKGYSFIVDPIDGTMNFIRDMKESCISAALLYDGQPVIGMVYTPYKDELFTAVKGKGARKNGVPIHVSDRPVSEALIAFGTSPYYSDLAKKSFDTAFALCMKGLDVRRAGSAALDLCNLACGRTDMFFEYRLSPWDYAAGALIVSEAGGSVTRFDGKPLDFAVPGSVFARGTGILLEDLPWQA